jgi:hypothetical protein
MDRLLAEMWTNLANTDIYLTDVKEEIRINQDKADANLEEVKEEMWAGQRLLKDEMLAKMDTYQERMEANHENRDAKTPIRTR